MQKDTTVSQTHYLLGSRFDTWLELLWKNRFQVSKKKIPQVLYITFITLLTFPFAILEAIIFFPFIYISKPKKAPVFILGHWRSGTTYLQNIMSCDPNFSYFDAVSTYTFNNFLLMGPLLYRAQEKSVAQGRPMDNMKYQMDSPTEEIFALTGMSTSTEIHMLAFPKKYKEYINSVFVSENSDSEKKKFINRYRYIIQKMTFARKGKRLLLKSPSNTARVGLLNQLFQKAKYIHIYRNPYSVIPSTINMFTKMFEMFALDEIPSNGSIEDEVIDLFARVYRKYFKDMKAISNNQLIEIKYEDFVKDPMNYMKEIYQTVDLPDYEAVAPLFQEHVNTQADYKRNKYEISPGLRRKINDKLGFFFDYYGYEMKTF